MASERFVCTASDPWTEEKGGRAVHPDARHERDDYDLSDEHDDLAWYRCPHCNLLFATRLPN